MLKLTSLQRNKNFDLPRPEWFKVMEHTQLKVEELKV